MSEWENDSFVEDELIDIEGMELDALYDMKESIEAFQHQELVDSVIDDELEGLGLGELYDLKDEIEDIADGEDEQKVLSLWR